MVSSTAFITFNSHTEIPNRTCPQVQPWLYSYNAYDEVEDALRRTPFTEIEPGLAVPLENRQSQRK